MALNNLYSIRSNSGIFHDLYKIIVASSTAIFTLVIFIFSIKVTFFSRIILVTIWIFSICLIFLGRLALKIIRRNLLKRGVGVRKVLLVGNNKTTLEIIKTIKEKYNWGYKVIGVIGDEHGDKDTKIVGTLENLPLILKKNQVDELILTDMAIGERKTMPIIQTCYDQKITFKYVPDVFSLVVSGFRPGLFGTMPVMELKSIPLDGWGRIIKRVLDIVFAGSFILLLSPLLLIISLLIVLSSQGPVFYLRKRVGRDGKTFDFYKFRSMYLEKCDYKGGAWTTAADDKNKVTPFGKILRKTNFDELPQLFNIFKGDMSFVGPRPEFPEFVARFEKEIPDYFRRHRVKAGLTGWAQVNGLKGDTSIEDRVRYDIYYIENWSIWFDFKIIIKTAGLVLYEAFNGKVEYSSRPRMDN
jgi:exopolysaccharide biosynthesis polyprenyl glycosylphosphotransferase